MRTWDVTADEVEHWASSPRAKGSLPVLVHRLLCATAKPAKATFPGDSSVYRGGYDGELETAEGGLFWPAGRSIWELSTETQALGKIRRDYAKRQADPPDAKVHYVAVTARRVTKLKRERWINDHANDDAFASVAIVDADDLAQWLSLAPAVATWFRETELHDVGARDVVSIERALDDWRNETAPPFNPRMLLLGRERLNLAAELRAWADDGVSQPITLIAAEPHEAAMFAVATLAMDPVGAEKWKARAVVVRSSDAFHLVSRLDTRDILPILDFQPDGPIRQDRKVVVTHHIGTSQGIVVPDAPWGVLAEGLVQHVGLDPQDAEARARDAHGSLQAVRQPFARAAFPPWVSKYDPEILGALVLMGAVQPTNEVHKSFARALLDRDPIELFSVAQKLQFEPRSPVVVERTYHGETVAFGSHREAWAYVSQRISTPMLNRFVRAAAEALTGTDADGPLMRSVSTSVARLGWSDTPAAARDAAAAIIRLVLDDAPASRWSALASCLPLLAEASPRTFLGSCSSFVRRKTDVADWLASRHDRGHVVAMMWALERLAWEEDSFSDVVDIIARLAESDAPTNMSPKPFGVLVQLLDVRVPQTNAADEVIIAALVTLTQQHEVLAFQVLQALDGPHMYMEQHPLEVMSTVVKSFDERLRERHAGVKRRYDAVVELLLRLAGLDGLRWAAIASRSKDDPRFLVALEERLPSITVGRQELWNALRNLLHEDAWHAAYGQKAARLLDPEPRERLERLYERLAPEEDVARLDWLFRFDARLPRVGTSDWREQQREVDDLRLGALDALQQRDGAAGIVRFLSALDDPLTAHEALHRSGFREATILALEETDDPKLDSLYAVLSARRALDGAVDLEHAIRHVQEHAPRRALEVAFRLPHDDRTWDAVDGMGPAFSQAYWSKLHHLFDSSRSGNERAVRSLVAHGNLKLAFHVVLTNPERVLDELGVSVVQAALDGRAEWLHADDFHLTYWLPRLFDRWRTTHPLSDYDLAIMAIRAWRLMDRHEDLGGLQWATPLFETKPSLFVHIVAVAHGHSVTPAGELPGLTKDEAAGLLYGWRGAPFCSPTVNEDALFQWLIDVANGATAASLTPHSIGSHLADLIARTPSSDGVWPAIATRRLLAGAIPNTAWTDDLVQHLARSLPVARWNTRGIHTRDLGDGGRQERELSETYRNAATRLRQEWPATAKMLDELARDYEGDARTEDAHTRTMARREGFELTGLTAVDMLVAIVLSTWEYERLDQDGVARLAALLDLATPIVVVALRALEESRLLYADGTRRVNRTLLRHHLLQEPSPFRVTSLGMRGMGLPTALSSAAISSELSEPHDAFVTPLEGGSAAGIVVPPLHPRAPYVAEKSPKVAMILALVDVLRLPQPGQRAVNLARSKLAEVL